LLSGKGLGKGHTMYPLAAFVNALVSKDLTKNFINKPTVEFLFDLNEPQNLLVPAPFP